MGKYFVQVEVYDKTTFLLESEDIQFVDEINYNSFSSTSDINQCIAFDNCMVADSFCDYLINTFGEEKENVSYRYGFKVVTIKDI